MADGADLLIGIDSGTSVVKAVAFDLGGRQVAAAAVLNRFVTGKDGSACQSLEQTWTDCVSALRDLGEKVENFARRTVAIAVTAQGDGTWLVGSGNAPVGDAWLWLDARAAPTVERLSAGRLEAERFEATGTGLNTCQQGAQLAQIDRSAPEVLDRAEVALHCKDWLYLNLTGVRATDPSEASWTFGNFCTRRYDDTVIEALGLTRRRGLLPGIIDGTQITHPLTDAAARATGLAAGTPVSLGYVDMVMTALGAGVHTGDPHAACTIIGSTGVHLRAKRVEEVRLNAERTGYVMTLPVPGMVTQMQTNMAAALNIDWALRVAADLMAEAGQEVAFSDLVSRIEPWLAASRPATLIYHPYISEAGERGPFVNANARAGFIGLTSAHRFPDLLRAVVEGLGMAARDCYAAMGELPSELRLSGGAARSPSLRAVLAAAVHAPVRVSSREEAGAAGAAMMAAVAIGAYPSMDDCIARWVTPLLGAAEAPDPSSSGSMTGCFRPTSRPAVRWRRYGRRSRAGVPKRNRRRGGIAHGDPGIREEHGMTETGMIDLLVIGGGINGAGIARDAAGRGLSVVLCEKDDLAEGCSSRSGKLVHGGLRYLEYYEFRLVREALIEREVLLRSASHIIWPMRFVLPHSPEDRPAWLVRLGLFLYDHLGGRKKLPGTRALDLRRDPEGAPILEKYAKGFEYSDCWVDDARLVVLNALGAAEKGAEILTRMPCVSARREDGAWTAQLRDEHSGQVRTVRARVIVNAAGPWVNDIIGRVVGSSSRRNVRLVKGSHIIVPKFWEGRHAYLVQNRDKRVIFINPYEGDLALIGTTDIAYEGRPEDVRADEAEIEYLIAAVNRYFKEKLRRSDVIQSFSGVRPLFDDGKGNPSAVTRDYVFDLDETGGAPLLNVFGGKITTFRELAERGIQRLAKFFPNMGGDWTGSRPAPRRRDQECGLRPVRRGSADELPVDAA